MALDTTTMDVVSLVTFIIKQTIKSNKVICTVIIKSLSLSTNQNIMIFFLPACDFETVGT